MEELIDSFAASEVTKQSNSTFRDHPLFSLYKAKPSAASQEERRKRFLEAQKLKRYDYASHARGLATNEWNDDGDDEEEEEKELEKMDFEEVVVKPSRSYKNQLMLSEWFVEVPTDLVSQWLLVLCPVGKRCLVVSSRGSTKVYTKSGYMLKSFPSKLPGGNRSNPGAYSLLDCIYSELEKTYYILDVMCWNSHPCFDSDTEFRFYWLHSKIEEEPDVKSISKDNPFKFIPLPHFDCDTETIKKTMWSPLPFEPQLDGLLFYHKKTHYICGTTPLVGWLKAYMLPEILQTEVPTELSAEKPANYVSMQQLIPEAFEKNEQRKQQDEITMQYEDV